MDIEDIREMHQVDEGIIDDPYLPRGKAISMLQQAHQHRDLLLAEVERLRQFATEVEETYLEALCETQRERDEALARVEKLKQYIEVLHDVPRTVR